MAKRTYDIMTARSGNSKKWKHHEMGLKEIKRYLGKPTILGMKTAEYHDLNNSDKSVIKLKNPAFLSGYFKGKRSNHTIETRSIIVFDIDQKFPSDFYEYMQANCRWSFYIYESLSSLPNHKKYRVLLFLDEDIKASEYEPVARKLASDLRIIDFVDKTCYKKAQLMYAPVFFEDSANTLNEYSKQDESKVCVKEVLRTFNNVLDTLEWKTAKDEGALHVSAHMQLGDPREKAGLVGAFCRWIGDVPNAIEQFDLPYKHEHQDRYSYTLGESANGFVVYDDGQYSTSNHESDPANNGHGNNAFDLVRIHKFKDLDTKDNYVDPKKAPSYKAMVEMLEGNDEFKRVHMAQVNAASLDNLMTYVESDFDEFAEDEAPKKAKKKKKAKKEKRNKKIVVNGKLIKYNPFADKDEFAEQWNEFLNTLERTQESGIPKPTRENLQKLLLNSPQFGGRILYDEFRRCTVYVGRKQWAIKGEEWQDHDTTSLLIFCETQGMRYSKQDINDGVRQASMYNSYNSLHDFFENGLPEWDGTPRIDTMFHDFLDADASEVNALIARKTLLGGLERAMVRGESSVHAVPILAGAQGAGKSRFWRKLCPSPDWFSDSKINIGHKDGMSVLGGSFIFELGELASLKKADEDEIKSFISSSKDKYRPSHMQYDVTIARHNIFVGSVNGDEFLRDPTGNRRWKVVVCHGKSANKLNEKMTEAVVLQIWAEAMELRNEGVPHWYDESEEEVTEEVANEHVVRGAMEDLAVIAATSYKPTNWELLDGSGKLEVLNAIAMGTFDEELTEAPAERFQVRHIAEMLNIAPDQLQRYQTQIGRALANCDDIEKSKWKVKGTQYRGYKIK